jgi:hypothetical protein
MKLPTLLKKLANKQRVEIIRALEKRVFSLEDLSPEEFCKEGLEFKLGDVGWNNAKKLCDKKGWDPGSYIQLRNDPCKSENAWKLSIASCEGYVYTEDVVKAFESEE